jgi:hypothetical protein
MNLTIQIVEDENRNVVRCTLEETRFNSPTWCGHCGKFIYGIIGKQGYSCIGNMKNSICIFRVFFPHIFLVCHFPCHTKCKDQVANSRICGTPFKKTNKKDSPPKTESEDRAEELEHTLLPCYVCANEEVLKNTEKKKNKLYSSL